MKCIICLLILFCIPSLTFSQNDQGLIIYKNLAPFNSFRDGIKNEIGYQVYNTLTYYENDSISQPGILIQLDKNGYILNIDTLRKHQYSYINRVDTIVIFLAFNQNKAPDTVSTIVLELCDQRGNVIKEVSHDFIDRIPSSFGSAQLNDSVWVFASTCVYNGITPGAVFFEVNFNSLNVNKRIAFNGGIQGNILRIDENPTFLEWTFGLWIKDTSFRHTTKVETNLIEPYQFGTMLRREDKPGWFGFGECFTPIKSNSSCLFILDENYKVSDIDIIYDNESNNKYSPHFYTTIVKNNDFYYAAGKWDVQWNYQYFYAESIPTQMYILKYDLELNRVWLKIVGGDRRYLSSNILSTHSGGFMLTGGLMDNLDNFGIYPFAMFFDEDGELVGTERPEPGHYEFTIYGNPGREALRIMSRFEGYRFQLQVVDMMGRPVLNTTLAEGMNHFDTTWWPSGPYLMSITDDHGRVVWSQPWIRE